MRISLFRKCGSHSGCRVLENSRQKKNEKLFMNLYDCVDCGRITGNPGPNLSLHKLVMQKYFLCPSCQIYRPQFSHLPEFPICIWWLWQTGSFQYMCVCQIRVFYTESSSSLPPLLILYLASSFVTDHSQNGVFLRRSCCHNGKKWKKVTLKNNLVPKKLFVDSHIISWFCNKSFCLDCHSRH